MEENRPISIVRWFYFESLVCRFCSSFSYSIPPFRNGFESERNSSCMEGTAEETLFDILQFLQNNMQTRELPKKFGKAGDSWWYVHLWKKFKQKNSSARSLSEGKGCISSIYNRTNKTNDKRKTLPAVRAQHTQSKRNLSSTRDDLVSRYIIRLQKTKKKHDATKKRKKT